MKSSVLFLISNTFYLTKLLTYFLSRSINRIIRNCDKYIEANEALWILFKKSKNLKKRKTQLF